MLTKVTFLDFVRALFWVLPYCKRIGRPVLKSLYQLYITKELSIYRTRYVTKDDRVLRVEYDLYYRPKE
jgi:hypothetical protein